MKVNWEGSVWSTFDRSGLIVRITRNASAAGAGSLTDPAADEIKEGLSR
jgi:hypothetical protein